jgi:hypothetical protein
MKQKKVIAAILILMLSSGFAMSGDGGQQPEKQEKRNEAVQVQSEQAQQVENDVEEAQVAQATKQEEVRTRVPEMSFSSFTTSELIDLFISNTLLLATIGLFEDYKAKIKIVMNNELTVELLKRNDSIDEMLKAFNVKANTKDYASKELIILFLSSKESVKLMNKNDKFKTIELTFSIYFTNEMKSTGGVIPSHALNLLTNVLEDEGYKVFPNKDKNVSKSDFKYLRDWQEVVFKTCIEYLDSGR